MSNETHLCKVDIEDTVFYLHCTLHNGGNGGVDLLLSDCQHAWQGTIEFKDLLKLSKRVKMEITEFLTETSNALTKTNIRGQDFIYELSPGDKGAVKLQWKKHISKDNIKFQLGEVNLSRCGDASALISKIFDLSINKMNSLEKQISTLEADKQRLASERTGAIKRLEKCVAAKEELETDLYAKFVTVLNNKKSKMRELRDEIEEVKSGTPSTSNSRAAAAMEVDDDDASSRDGQNDSDYDTDEDKQPAHRPKRSWVSGHDALPDSSLILDTDDGRDTEPKLTRRRRVGRGVKTTTPAKPVIPRVSSTEKTQTRTTSMRSSTSRKSSLRSQDNLDPNDLLGDLA